MTEENKKPSEEMTEDVNTAAAQEETSADEETPENKEQASESTSESSECDEKEVKTEEKADSSEETKEKKFFGKKKEKKDKKDEKIEELTDQVKRQMAEFDNYRKRTEKEKASMYFEKDFSDVSRNCVFTKPPPNVTKTLFLQ